jgi:glycosyltransferase involved in cell wall biosynthesis
MKDRGMVRVAYDVSSVVPPPGTSRMVTGIGRVIEEHLARLRNNPSLNLRVVGAFAEDWNPVVTSIAAEHWAARSCVPPVASLRTFKTKSSLGKAAAGLLYRLEERANRSAQSSGIRRRVLLLVTALVRRVALACVKVGLGPDEIDLFHAPFRAPPEWLHRSIPRVITIHDVIPVRHAEEAGPDATGMLKTVLAALNPTRDVVVAVSQFTKDDFCELSGFPPERVVVAHLSAGPIFRPVEDRDRIARVRARWGLENTPFLLSVANPQPRKNIPLLIRAFFNAATQLPSWTGKLILVGNPKAGRAAETTDQEIAKRPELANRILRASGVPDEDLACLYSECEAFLFPSTYEGFGLPVLEALQCAAPVICSNRSSLPEVAGPAAVLVDPDDEAAVTQAIVEVINNPVRREELKRLSVEQAVKFSWEKSGESVAQAYMLALNPPSKTARLDARLTRVGERRHAVIVSGIAPSYVGGLGAYQRFLARALQEHFGIEGIFLAVKAEHPTLERSDEQVPWPVETLKVRPAWAQAQRVLSSMASRPLLHPLLERLAAWLVPAASLKRIEELGDWIHFVGTGWDFFGFPLREWARRQDKKFTIWPAVHPRSWGDDIIDVRLYAGADAIFCQSKHEKTHLGALGVPHDKLVWCGLPPMCRMDGNAQRFREKHNIPAETTTVLFLGRRDEGKGYPALLKAWPLVLQRFPQAILLLAGPGGSDYQKLKDLIPAESLRDLGVPDEVGKADALAACDIFCLPSSHEAFGIAYVEAWAYGKPVICGLAAACRELIQDGVTGVWGDQDPASLAEKILSLLEQPEYRERLGRDGRARQQRDFTTESVARVHVEAVEADRN